MTKIVSLFSRKPNMQYFYKILSRFEREVDFIVADYAQWSEKIEKADFVSNVNLYKRQNSEGTYEELFARISSALTVIESLWNYYVFEDDFIKRTNELNRKITQLKKSVSMVKQKSDEITQESFSHILKKICEEKNNTITRENIKNILSVSYSDFINEILILPIHIKKKAYLSLIETYILDCQHGNFRSSKFSMKVAEGIHNLPFFLSRDLENFDDDYFWHPIFNSKTKNYLVQHFFKGLVSAIVYHPSGSDYLNEINTSKRHEAH